VTPVYLETVSLIERLYRQFLDVVKDELDRLEVDDINNVQCLILYNIGQDELTVGELTQRGCYMGTNVTYNLKKMIEAGYVTQQRSPRDRRSVRVRLSTSGLELVDRLAVVFDAHSAQLANEFGEKELSNINERLRVLERFWTDILDHGGAPTRRSRHAA
jgi:DNA-binding MarR family transcriptional regulator